MFFAAGWAIVRAAREPYEVFSERELVAVLPRLDAIDSEIRSVDLALFSELEGLLSGFKSPDLTWHFERQLNNHAGILHMSSSRNHRGTAPSAVEVLKWLAVHGSGSYGLLYVHDDEDADGPARDCGRNGTDYRNEFRVWRLLRGTVEELADPFLSPIVPRIDPNEFA